MALLAIQNLTKIFPGAPRPALEDFSLEIAEGELLVLTGPAGCGKTTLLRIIAGLEAPTRGEILIDGRRVNEISPNERGAAIVFQNPALYPHLTVYRNLAFGLMLRKFPKDEIDRRVRAAAGLLGLADALDRKPRAISAGQRAFVALGRAIVMRPRIYLLDEPLGALNAASRASLRAEIARLRAALGATILYATADPAEAAALGARLAVLNQGRLQQIGTPQEILARPANDFVAGFLAPPPY